MMLELENLTVAYGALTIVDGISFTLPDGEWLMIAGPNGAGKSTIIGAISQNVKYTGSVRLDGEDAARMKPAKLARKLGVLTQNHWVSYSFSVEEVVRLGRYSHSRGLFGGAGNGDNDAVERALELTGMTALRSQSVLTLSGGELQRAFLAQLIAQDPELMLLDEPTNHLDLVYQKQTFSLVRDWIAQTGRSVVSVVHDLSLARAFGTRTLLLEHGHAVEYGETKKVLSRENLRRVYSLDVVEYMRGMFEQWNDSTLDV